MATRILNIVPSQVQFMIYQRCGSHMFFPKIVCNKYIRFSQADYQRISNQQSFPYNVSDAAIREIFRIGFYFPVAVQIDEDAVVGKIGIIAPPPAPQYKPGNFSQVPFLTICTIIQAPRG